MATRQQLLDTALDHYADRQRLVLATEQAMASIWSEVDPARIADSWANLLPEAVAVVSGAQLAAARPAQSYVDEVLADEDASTPGVGEANPVGFAGQASDARGLIGLLTNPVVVTLLSIQDGIDVARALGLGRQNLQMLSATQVADAGRLADQTGITARPAANGYTRMAVGNSCARCLILAGTFYEWNRGFQRHPKCDCVHVPAASDKAKTLRNPQQIYDRMTRAERTRAGFTLADQRAISEGADLAQVVNAHRGMYVAGGRKLTSEGTTKRGLARKFRVDPETGRLVRKTPREAAEPRLSVDEIFREAGDDRDLAVALLGENAYLRIGVPAPRREAIDLTARASGPSGAGAAGAPTPAPTIRPALADAKSITAVNQAFAREYQRITGNRVYTIDLQGSIQTAKEHAEGLLRCLERFPDANLHEVVTILADATDSRYAEAAFSYVGFSEEWVRNRPRYLKALQADEADGFHVPNSGNPIGVAIHEFGHNLDIGTLGDRIQAQVDAYLQTVATQLGQSVEKVIEVGVSGYALKTRSELIAEAFTDVILNGPQASAISRGIFDLLEAEYKRPGSDRLGGAIIAQPKASRPGSVGHLTVPQLKALARERGIVVPPGAKKADLVRLIDDAPQPSSAVMFGDLSGLRQVSEQTRGSNPAAMFEAPDGSRWYVKAVADRFHAGNEALAAALYREAGIDVPVVVRSNVGPPGLDGEAFVASRVDPRSTPATLAALNDPASVARMREGFAADAWLANWDVMGGGYHNIVIVGGSPIRVDPGGALLYRGGLGRPKGDSFGKSVVEWDSLRDPKRSRNAADLYEGMTAAELAGSAARVLAVTPARIRALVAQYEMPPGLADTLIARQQDLGRRLSKMGTPPSARGPVDEILRRAAKDADALAAPPIQMTRVRQAGGDAYADLIPDPAQRAAAFDSIEGYVDTPRVINQTLRAPGQDRFVTPEIFDEIMGEVANIDRAMAASRLPESIVVYRGRRGDSVLGPRDTWGNDLAGREWVDPAPASASAMESVGEHFAGRDGVVMRIVVPEGTGAIQLSAKNYEAEILLERGLRYRVVRDNGTVGGRRRLDVEVVPAAEPVDNAAKRAAADFDARAQGARKGQAATAQTRYRFSGNSNQNADLFPDRAERVTVMDAFAGYRGIGFSRINKRLRAGDPDRRAELMDRAFARSPLGSDVLVYRGTRGRSIFGPRESWPSDLTGVEWTDPAYASTSASLVKAEPFAKGDGVVMRVVVPQGTPAVGIRPASRTENPEAEILLGRGLKFRVVADHGEVDGIRRIDVEVIRPLAAPTDAIDNAGKRTAARARQADIDAAQTRATALADLDEKLGAGATPATLKAELDVLAQTKALAAADITALRRVVATGDRAKIDAAVDRLTKKYKLTGVVRAGDVTTMRQGFDVVGGRQLADGAQVKVVRRGTEVVRDGERIVLSPPLVRELDATDLARIRQAAISEKRASASVLTDLFGLLDSGVDAAVLKRRAAFHRNRLAEVDPAVAVLLRAAETGDSAKVKRALATAAKKLEITRIGGDFGKPIAFDRRIHEGLPGERLRDGQTVELVEPAWTMTYRGETIQLGKAKVQEIDLAELRQRAVKAVEDLLDRVAKPTAAALKKVDAVKVGTVSKTKTVAYDPKVHDAGGATIPAGAKVRIVEPGYSVTVGRETVVVRKPVVEAVTPFPNLSPLAQRLYRAKHRLEMSDLITEASLTRDDMVALAREFGIKVPADLAAGYATKVRTFVTKAIEGLPNRPIRQTVLKPFTKADVKAATKALQQRVSQAPSIRSFIGRVDSREVNDQITKVFSDVLDGEYPGGIRIGDVSGHLGSDGQTLNFSAAIFDQAGDNVGYFTRFLHYDEGQWVMFHHKWFMDSEVQGTGLANSINAALFDWYRSSGIDAVSTGASSIGAYTWAAQGFDFESKAALREFVDEQEMGNLPEGARLGDVPGYDDPERRRQQKLLDGLIARVRRGEWVSAYDFSQAGRVAGQGVDDWWIGKEYMLRKGGFNGKLKL